jgi:tRNA (cmo5U34)-methyltransferase
MAHDPPTARPAWDEDDSRNFIDVGRYFVPDREAQITMICDLIPATAAPFYVLELCCGEGLLAAAILERYPQAAVHGMDGSPAMLAAAQARLAGYSGRFTAAPFDLAAPDWRVGFPWPVRAVISSLAIHHLDGPQKQALFADVYRLLAPGGALIVADLIQPADGRGVALAAAAWDAAVRERALALDGDPRAFAAFADQRWNIYLYPDPGDKPSGLFEQLQWLAQAGFAAVDAYWLRAGHAIYGGRKPGP